MRVSTGLVLHDVELWARYTRGPERAQVNQVSGQLLADNSRIVALISVARDVMYDSSY